MNRQRAKELLPIITAFAEGKNIQKLMTGINEYWHDLNAPEWHDNTEYRIKPERRKVWVHFSKNGSIYMRNGAECMEPTCKVVCVEEPE